MLLQSGKPNEAIKQYTEALRHEPEDIDASYNMGIVGRQWNLDSHNPFCKSSADSNRLRVSIAFAELLTRRGRFDEAEAQFVKRYASKTAECGRAREPGENAWFRKQAGRGLE